MIPLDFKITDIIDRFPNINYNTFISYNNNKSSNILFDTAPDGNNNLYILKLYASKAYLWFTYYKNKFICIMSLIHNKINSDTSKYYYYNVKFDDSLLYNNVLLYGYYICKNNVNYFIIENVLNYNNYNHYINSIDYTDNYNIKLNLYSIILNNFITLNNYKIMLPYMCYDIDKLFKQLNLVDYNIYSIMVYKNLKYLGNYILKSNESSKISATFRVKAHLPPDLYMLYISDNNKIIEYEYAFINSYKTSVFMNSLFRKIKENKNLDLLEESDSDFEDISITKYVNLIKTYNIECIYNSRFKKWVPLKLSKNNIIEKNKINFVKKTNIK